MSEDYDDWTSAQMAKVIKEKITMWDLLDHMEIDYPRRGHEGVKISIRDETVPSCHVYEDGFYDYGTGEGGSVIDFYMLMTGKTKLRRSCQELLSGEIGSGTVKRSVKELVNLTDRFMSESDPLEAHREDVEWFLEHKWRPISWYTATWAGIRATKHGIWIPFFGNGELSGDVVGVKVRGWSGVKTSIKGSTFGSSLWAPFHNPHPTKTLVLCEGESDMLALWQMFYEFRDVPYVIAGLPSGAGKWNKNWLEPWLRADGSTTVVVLHDNDEAGKNVAEKIESSYDRVVSLRTEDDVRTDIQTTTTFWEQPLLEVLTDGKKRECA